MRLRIMGAVAAVALVAAACSSSSSSSTPVGSGGSVAPVPISVTMTSWVGYGLFHLAEEKGFFDQHGVDMTIKVVEDESNNPAALASNQIQGDLTTVDTNVRSIAAGVDLVQVMAVDDSNGADGIVGTADIQSVQDLAGKKVGVKVGATSYVFLLSVLKDAGMSINDIQVVDMNPGEAGTAFVAGNLDAAVTWEPFLSKATQRPGGHVVISSKDAPGLIVDSLAINRDWVTAHPDAVTGLIQAYNEAYDYWKSNPDESWPIMAKSQGISVDDYKAAAEGVTFYGPQEMADFMNAPIDQTGILKLTSYINDFWVQEGVIPQAIDPAAAIDGSYAKAAVQGA